MPGFWLKAVIAAVIVALVIYGVLRLKKKWSGCLTLALMLFIFLVSPILWVIAYYSIPIYYLEPFKGRVVEKETGKPIPEAAVAVEYVEEFHGFQTHFRIVDAKETITDENGEYYIRSKWRFQTGGTPYGEVTIFKPGYSVERKRLRSFLDTFFYPTRRHHRYWNTPYQEYELKKLTTNEERLKHLRRADDLYDSRSKLIHWHFLIDEERRYLGLSSRNQSKRY